MSCLMVLFGDSSGPHTTTVRDGAASAKSIDYRCDDRHFWLSARDCQVPTPTSQNLDLEQQIRVCEAE